MGRSDFKCNVERSGLLVRLHAELTEIIIQRIFLRGFSWTPHGDGLRLQQDGRLLDFPLHEIIGRYTFADLDPYCNGHSVDSFQRSSIYYCSGRLVLVDYRNHDRNSQHR